MKLQLLRHLSVPALLGSLAAAGCSGQGLTIGIEGQPATIKPLERVDAGSRPSPEPDAATDLDPGSDPGTSPTSGGGSPNPGMEPPTEPSASSPPQCALACPPEFTRSYQIPDTFGDVIELVVEVCQNEDCIQAHFDFEHDRVGAGSGTSFEFPGVDDPTRADAPAILTVSVLGTEPMAMAPTMEPMGATNTALQLSFGWRITQGETANYDIYTVSVHDAEGIQLVQDRMVAEYQMLPFSCVSCEVAVDANAMSMCSGMCPPGTYCSSDGECAAEPGQICTGPTDATTGEMTAPATCYRSCETQMDCPTGFTCTDLGGGNGCVPDPQSPCQADSDCPAGEVCMGLPPGGMADPSGMYMTYCAAPPVACMADSDCGPGWYCMESQCQVVPANGVPCMTDAACPDGWACDVDTATCVPPSGGMLPLACMTDSDCPADTHCDPASALCAASM